jgi:hypothetical protein
LTQLRLFFLRSSFSLSAIEAFDPRGSPRTSFAALDLVRDSSMRASQSVNSSSPGAEAVDATDWSRRIEGRLVLRGLLKRGEEARMGCLLAAIEEAAEEVCRGRRVYEASSEERSRDERERLGPEGKERVSARVSTGAGTGSWKRTVRLGLVVVVEVDVKEV